MQNKGAILVFTVLLVLVSVYQLWFTREANNVRKDAAEYALAHQAQADLYVSRFEAEASRLAGNNAQRKALYLDERRQLFLDSVEQYYLDSIANQPVYNFFWIKEFTYRECQEREINLGLDLKGGMNVTLEVSVIDLVRSMAGYSSDSSFVKAIRIAKERQRTSQKDFITLFGEAFKVEAPYGRLASPNLFGNLDMRDKITSDMTNDQVLDVIRQEANDAIDNSFNILRTRIDRFGVTQPNVQRLETDASRILVELPGVKDRARVRKLLEGSANLEFWLTYDNSEVFGSFQKINTLLKDMGIGKETAPSVDVPKADTTKTTLSSDSTLTDLVNTTTKTTPDTTSKLEDLVADSTTVQADADREKWAAENPFFAVLNPVTTEDGRLGEGCLVGYVHIKDTAKVMSYLRMDKVQELLPRELVLAWTVKPLMSADKQPTDFFQIVALRAAGKGEGAALSGDVITNASADFGQGQAEALVTMTMDGEGTKEWARLTKENIGRPIAVVLDGLVYSHPFVRSEIPNGRSEISGGFDVQEAKDLANILKSGKMPAPARIIEEEVVGPSLGQEAIDSGIVSFIIAFILVLLYMALYYNGAGLVADIALAANVFFIFGVLASLQAVLTLPGIAGIVLTLGMAVDANVIIYERVREELRLGKNPRNALADGYKHAYSAILDGNITTLLTAIVLLVFGHGPVKGFATTLIIGILTSLFSAIFISRLIFEAWLSRNKPIAFGNRITNNVFKNANFQFINKRKVAYVVSGVLVTISLVALFTKGLNEGVDFKGGRTYVVRFNESVNTVDVANSLKATLGEAPEVKTFGKTNQVKIITKYMIDSEDPNADMIVETAVYEGLKPMLGGVSMEDFAAHYQMSSQKVGPTIADDIKVGSFYAILGSLVVMFLYIFFRFKNWQYGMGAVVALTHDALIVMGCFSIFYTIMPFSMEVNQAFVAAILTVIGYSVNDTVIVFDRIREYLKLHKSDERKGVFNNAINSTLGRTMNTSGTTLVVLIIMFMFGGEVIQGFIFALLVGIGVGTYSSVFVATPIVFDTVRVKVRMDNKLKSKKSASAQPQAPAPKK